jgi:L-lactate dehydrogenase
MPKTTRGKVAVIGAGFVGATSAYALMNAGTASEIVLVDIDRDKLEGEVLDLDHGITFVPPVRILAGDYESCSDAELIILTAGASQKPGESRLDLLKKNAEVFKDILPGTLESGFKGIFLVVTNPVDILTYVTLKLSGFDPSRVIGSGTLLDTARFRYLVSKRCGIAPQNVHAHIIGEHGDSEVAAWSAVNIAGIPFESFCESCNRPCGMEEKESIARSVKEAAYKIIDKKGATYYAIGLSVRRIVQALLRDENSVLTVSSLLTGMYGIEDVCLSLPSIINRKGIASVLKLPLSEEEAQALRSSAATIKDVLQELDVPEKRGR